MLAARWLKTALRVAFIIWQEHQNHGPTVQHVATPLPPPPPSKPNLGSQITGSLLLFLGVLVWPVGWVVSGYLHAERCGFSFPVLLCHEPLGDFVLHQSLVSLSPVVSLILAFWGSELRARR